MSKHPVLLYVAGQRNADHTQRKFDPSVVRVLPHYACNAYRGSAVIIERPGPEVLASETERARFERWVDEGPRCRLEAGAQDSLVFV